MPKYFVGRWEPTKRYRVYSTAKYIDPSESLSRSIIWRGDDYNEGVEVMKSANLQAKPPLAPKIALLDKMGEQGQLL